MRLKANYRHRLAGRVQAGLGGTLGDTRKLSSDQWRCGGPGSAADLHLRSNMWSLVQLLVPMALDKLGLTF